MRSIRTALAACAVALAVSPGAAAADFTFVSGNGTPPGRDALTQFSTNGGVTWQDAYIVARNPFYSQLSGSQWISVSPSSGSPTAHTRYRRSFDLPPGCQGATLTARIHVDNEATVWLNGTQFGATPVGELFATFTDPAEGPYTTAGPFLATGNVLEFRVRNYSGPTALNYAAVLSCALDTTAPTVSCTVPENRWHADDVTVECTASDSGSGLADPSAASFTLSTSVPAGTETPEAATGSRQVCDASGNCVTAGPYAGIKVDRKAPTVMIASPSSWTYLLNASVVAEYSCSDGGSGIASCVGPVESRTALLDTASAGTKTFGVEAADAAGNRASTSVQYVVSYGVRLLHDGTKPVPMIRLALVDAEGRVVSNDAISLTVTHIDTTPWSGTFDYIPNGTYRYSIHTRELAQGPHTLYFRAGADPTTHAAPFFWVIPSPK